MNGRESKDLTFTPACRPGKTLDHQEMETLAREVAREFRGHCQKLRALKPKIERIQDYFSTAVRGSVRLAGCSSFKEYCEKKLGRTKQAVYSMLGSYPTKQKEKKQRVPKGPPVYEGGLTQEDVTRMETGLNAVNRARDAEAKGQKQEALTAWQEYEHIAKAEPLKSRLAGDQPNYKMMLLDLLAITEQMLALLQRIEDAGILTNDAALLATTKSCTSRAGRLCRAYHQRLGITDANVPGGVN